VTEYVFVTIHNFESIYVRILIWRSVLRALASLRSSKDVPSLFCKSCFRAAFALSYARRRFLPCFQPAMELPSSGTLLCGPFLPATPSPESKCSHSCAPRKAKGTKPAEGLRPWRATRGTPIFRAALVQTGLRPPSTSFQVGTPPLALAAPAGVGQGQGVFVSKHSTAIQNRRNNMSSTATNETSNVNSLRTASKPQTSKEVIAANVKLLIEQLEAGHSEGLTAYLTAMGKFHNYSFGNILEIARQMPSASRVAGMFAWNHLGRRVKKGQRGIRILAPLLDTKRKNESEAEREKAKQNQPALVGFRAVYVFDVSQTEGAELPDLKERVKGNVGEYRERLINFILAQGIEIEFKESIGPALGVSYGGKIAILPGQSAAEEFLTLVHEASHLCCVVDYVECAMNSRISATIMGRPTQHKYVNVTFRAVAAQLNAEYRKISYRLNASRNLIDCLRDNSMFLPLRILTIRLPPTPVSTLSTHFRLRMHLRPARKKTAGSSRSSSVAKDRQTSGRSFPKCSRV
jgi:hypothetical protein